MKNIHRNDIISILFLIRSLPWISNLLKINFVYAMCQPTDKIWYTLFFNELYSNIISKVKGKIKYHTLKIIITKVCTFIHKSCLYK